jgi:hypothetical protein
MARLRRNRLLWFLLFVALTPFVLATAVGQLAGLSWGALTLAWEFGWGPGLWLAGIGFAMTYLTAVATHEGGMHWAAGWSDGQSTSPKLLGANDVPFLGPSVHRSKSIQNVLDYPLTPISPNFSIRERRDSRPSSCPPYSTPRCAAGGTPRYFSKTISPPRRG